MQKNKLLQDAIAKARSGHELTARELFLEVVRAEPKNELAWIWLVGLLDGLDERIDACQRVLQINPDNQKISIHLKILLAQQEETRQKALRRFRSRVNRVRQMAKTNPKDSLESIRKLTGGEIETAAGWQLLAELSDNIDERARALENFLRLAPKNNERAYIELDKLRYYQENPLGLAAEYEAMGKFEDAILVYTRMMMPLKSSDRAWSELYERIYGAEKKIRERLPFVSPGLSILRLTAGPSMLYLILLLMHVGFRPIGNPEPALWLGYFWVLVGGFLVALEIAHSPEGLQLITYRLFGFRSFPAALTARLIGYILIVVPYLLLFLFAYQRFKAFTDARLPW